MSSAVLDKTMSLKYVTPYTEAVWKLELLMELMSSPVSCLAHGNLKGVGSDLQFFQLYTEPLMSRNSFPILRLFSDVILSVWFQNTTGFEPPSLCDEEVARRHWTTV